MTTVEGYSLYCSAFGCEIPACAATLRMGGILYHEIGLEMEGRKVYKEENGQNFLFYSKNRWRIDETFQNEGVLKSSLCPQQGAVFEGIRSSFPPIPNVNSWTDCSSKCEETDACHFWQYESETKLCTLIEDFSTTRRRHLRWAAEVFTGSRHCPGDMYKSAFGQCVENSVSRSMWIKQGKDVFEKDLNMKAFDATSTILCAGTGTDVEMTGKDHCQLPDLPKEGQLWDSNVVLPGPSSSHLWWLWYTGLLHPKVSGPGC